MEREKLRAEYFQVYLLSVDLATQYEALLLYFYKRLLSNILDWRDY
jgi:hypothetical protein